MRRKYQTNNNALVEDYINLNIALAPQNIPRAWPPEKSQKYVPAPSKNTPTITVEIKKPSGLMGLSFVTKDETIYIKEVIPEIANLEIKKKFRPGDKILRINELCYTKSSELAKAIQEAQVGETIIFLIERSSSSIEHPPKQHGKKVLGKQKLEGTESNFHPLINKKSDKIVKSRRRRVRLERKKHDPVWAGHTLEVNLAHGNTGLEKWDRLHLKQRCKEFENHTTHYCARFETMVKSVGSILWHKPMKDIMKNFMADEDSRIMLMAAIRRREVYYQICQQAVPSIPIDSDFMEHLIRGHLVFDMRLEQIEENKLFCKLVRSRKISETITVLSLSCEQRFNLSYRKKILSKMKQNGKKASMLMDKEVMSVLAHHLPVMEKLVRLEILSVPPQCQNNKLLCQGLLGNKCLKSLIFVGVKLGDSGADALEPALLGTQIQELVLRRASIGKAGGGLCSRLINHHGTMKEQRMWEHGLRSKNGKLSNEKARIQHPADIKDHVRQTISMKGILSIDLSENKIDDAGAQLIASALLHDTWLLALNLSDNNIGLMGLRCLVDALASREETLSGVKESAKAPKAKPKQKLLTERGEDPNAFVAHGMEEMKKAEESTPKFLTENGEDSYGMTAYDSNEINKAEVPLKKVPKFSKLDKMEIPSSNFEAQLNQVQDMKIGQVRKRLRAIGVPLLSMSKSDMESRLAGERVKFSKKFDKMISEISKMSVSELDDELQKQGYHVKELLQSKMEDDQSAAKLAKLAIPEIEESLKKMGQSLHKELIEYLVKSRMERRYDKLHATSYKEKRKVKPNLDPNKTQNKTLRCLSLQGNPCASSIEDVQDYLFSHVPRLLDGHKVPAADICGWLEQTVLSRPSPDQGEHRNIVDAARDKWMGVLPEPDDDTMGLQAFEDGGDNVAIWGDSKAAQFGSVIENLDGDFVGGAYCNGQPQPHIKSTQRSENEVEGLSEVPYLFPRQLSTPDKYRSASDQDIDDEPPYWFPRCLATSESLKQFQQNLRRTLKPQVPESIFDEKGAPSESINDINSADNASLLTFDDSSGDTASSPKDQISLGRSQHDELEQILMDRINWALKGESVSESTTSGLEIESDVTSRDSHPDAIALSSQLESAIYSLTNKLKGLEEKVQEVISHKRGNVEQNKENHDPGNAGYVQAAKSTIENSNSANNNNISSPSKKNFNFPPNKEVSSGQAGSAQPEDCDQDGNSEIHGDYDDIAKSIDDIMQEASSC